MRVWALVTAASAAVLLRPGTSDAVRVRYEDEETELVGEPDGNQAEGAESEVVAPVKGGEAPEAAPEASAGGEGEQISTPAEQISTREVADSVACTLLPTWWKSRITNENNMPPDVASILDTPEKKQEYVNLMTAVLATPKAVLGNWKLSEVYKVMWNPFETNFEALNVNIFLKKVAKQVGGSEKSICFAAMASNIQNIPDQYHDNKDGLGTALPAHVVAWVLQPVRSAGGQASMSSASTEASIDLDKFVKSGGSTEGTLDVLWDRFKVDAKSATAPDKRPESHALNLLSLTLAFKDRFRAFNVTPTACYSREYAFSWRQLFNGYHLRLWVELKDSNEAKDYHSNYAILPQRTCEKLDDMVGPTDQPLEMRALLNTHAIVPNYKELTDDMRESKGDSPWDLAKVYQAMHNREKALLDSNVAMSLTKVAGADNICFIDLTQTIVEVDPDEFHDGDVVRTSTTNMKTLDHSVFAETLSNTSGQLLLPEPTPVDVQRMLKRLGADQIHQDMKTSLSELTPNPKGLPVQIRDVQRAVEPFRQAFRVKGINIFTCFTIEDIKFPISTNTEWPAHLIFTWLEFAEIGSLHREYRPAEVMPELRA